MNEGQDGYDTIEWAAAQPWSNGKIGTIGASYLAWDQYFAAMYNPPHLVAMYADVGGNNFYREFGYPGGAPNPGWTVWMLRSAATSGRAPADAFGPILKDPSSWFALPREKRAEVFANFPEQAKMFDDFYAHPSFDAYWKQQGFFIESGWKRMKDVPVFFVSGWYDYFIEGLIENFTALSKSQRSAKRMWLGPWPHNVGASRCGQVDFGAEAGQDMREVALEWFDHWMHGKPLRRIGAEPVRSFRMGGGDSGTSHGGEWTTFSAWPPREAQVRKYFLQAGGNLGVSHSNGESAYTHDPANPVPSIGGRYTMVPTIAPCAQDQSRLDSRSGVLRFQTPPLAEAVEVAGMVKAKLRVKSTAASTDFTAKLIDAAPDGFALILGDGIQRVKTTPGVTTDVEIEVGSLHNLFAKGHRIRVDIASSNYPRAETNPNPARNTVLHGGGRGSRLELPVIRPAR